MVKINYVYFYWAQGSESSYNGVVELHSCIDSSEKFKEFHRSLDEKFGEKVFIKALTFLHALHYDA